MKYLILILVLALVFFVLGLKRARPSRPEPGPKREAPKAPAAGAQDIVACAECGLHVPLADALPGLGGHFCSAAHRHAFEARSRS
jgi:uncharacterized protein